MAISPNKRDHDLTVYRENPSDQVTDRRTADIETHTKLDELISQLGGTLATCGHGHQVAGQFSFR